MNKCDIKTLTWRDVRKDVHQVNSKLASIIDDLDPGDAYKLYRVKYPYGTMIFTAGTLNLPNDSNDLVPIDHPTIAKKLHDDLTYRAIPMGLMLKKSSEIYAEMDDRVIPLTVLAEGRLFGVWEALDPPHSYFVRLSWNVSSGARSLFLLPKIAEASGYKRLQKNTGIRVNAPKKLKDQWFIFKKIINSHGFPISWFSEVLYFSKKWFESLKNDLSWTNLQNYFFKIVWYQSMYWRFSSTLNLMWQQFASIVKRYNVKCGIYQLETLKHLIALGVGALPSFSAQGQFDLLVPIAALQEIFLDIYELDYVPTIMLPHHLSMDKKGDAGYYSINEPTLIESVPKSREVLNIMQTIRDIQELFEYFKEEVMRGVFKVENTPIYDLINNVTFKFIHTAPDPSGQLTISNKLPKIDASLINMPDRYGDRPFCSTSNFLRGCAQIIT
jgi:hypothetical protein